MGRFASSLVPSRVFFGFGGGVRRLAEVHVAVSWMALGVSRALGLFGLWAACECRGKVRLAVRGGFGIFTGF